MLNLCGKHLKIFSLSLFVLGLVFFLGNSAKAASLLDVYQFNETTLASSTINHLDWIGGTVSTSSTGHYGAGLSDDGKIILAGGTNYGHIDDTVSSSGYTVSFWGDFSGADGAWFYLGGAYNGNDNQQIKFKAKIVSSPTTQIEWENQVAGACSSLTQNQFVAYYNSGWKHWAIEVSTTTVKWYIDATLAYTCTLTNPFSIPSTFQDFRVDNEGSHYLTDVAVFDNLLTPTEITNIKNAGHSVIVDYPDQTCGNALCEGTETFNTCPQDCPVPDYCGDGICMGWPNETFSNCPQDCPYLEDSGSFFIQNIVTCYYNNPCLLNFSFNPQIFGSYNTEISLTQCESKDYYDTATTLSCATSEDLIVDSPITTYQEYYLNDPGTLTVATPEIATSSQLTLYGAKIANDTTFNLIQFYVNWTKAPAWLDPPIKATSTVLMLFGTSTTALACSAEDWAKAASSTSWFNWTDLRCSSSKEIFDWMAIVSDRIEGFLNDTIAKGKNIFPFSLIVKVNQCYLAAASSTLPVELNAMDIADSDGNIEISLPTSSTTFGVSTTTAILSFGPDSMAPVGAAKSFHDLWIALTKYITYGLLGLGIVAFGLGMYNEIGFHETKEAHMRENWQL